MIWSNQNIALIFCRRHDSRDLQPDYVRPSSNPASDQKMYISITFVEAFSSWWSCYVHGTNSVLSVWRERARFCHVISLYCALFHSKLAQSVARHICRFYIECYIIFKANFVPNPKLKTVWKSIDKWMRGERFSQNKNIRHPVFPGGHPSKY